MIKLITPDGTERLIEDVPGSPSLRQMHAWLECDLIEVPANGFTVAGQEQQFIVDEEGKLKGKPFNRLATELYDDALAADPRGLMPGRDVLVGTVLILTEPNLLT